MKIKMLLISLTLIFYSCSKQTENPYQLAADNVSTPVSIVSPQVDNRTDSHDKKIIKDGRIGIKVQELNKTKARTDSLVALHGGYYANEGYNDYDWALTYELIVRIPNRNFEKFIRGVESGDGIVEYKEIKARDVTEQFIDLETRLENKRSYLKRYKELLKQAKSIKEILEIEEKIRVLEEEIESTTGKLKYLSDLVDYSTLELTITRQKELSYNSKNRHRFISRLKRSLSGGWHGLIDFLLFVIKIWPFLIVLAVVGYFWRRHRRKKRLKTSNSNQ